MKLGIDVDELLALLRLRRSIKSRKWGAAYDAARDLDPLDPDQVPRGTVPLQPVPSPSESC